MSTKRKIKDYIGQKIAIYCSSKEEWDKIDNLFGKKGLTRNYGDVSDLDNTFVNCIHINGMGTASKKYYEKENYSIYPASDFLEEVIPEYVEYIDTKYKGQIVKVEEWTSHSFCCIKFENGQREQPFKDLVKLSTKEAYEAQNKPKQLNVKDLIKGEIYVFDINSIKNFISKFDYSDSYNYYDTCFIQENEFDNEPESATISDINNIRLANNEEKKWLNTCISQDKFIPKEDLHLNEILNQYSLTPNESSQLSNYNSEDIYIPSIIKKQTKLQTITIESSINLNLNLTKIKSKQIQTIKI